MPLPTSPNAQPEPKKLPTQPVTPETQKPAINIPVSNTGGEKERQVLQPGEGNITAKIEDLHKKEEVKVVKAERTAKGKLTSEEILTKDYDTFIKPIEHKILELLEITRERFSQLGADDVLAEARKERGEKYKEQSYNIGDYLFAKITKDNLLRAEDTKKAIQMVINEMIGMGPIEPLWQNPNISEIMVNGPYDIKVELNGKIVDVPGAKFRDAKHLLELCQKILQDVGREVNASRPTADGRLPDYSRINVVAQNIAPEGPFLTIRRFPDTIFTVEELVKKNALTPEIALEIGNLVYKGCSMIVSGSTGSGKQLSHDTVIPTPTGMTTMGDLQVGEYVLDENGEPTLVTAKYSNKVPVAYEMTFSDGTKVVADEDHNWFTSTRVVRTRISREENSPKIVNAARVPFATPEEKEALINFYENAPEVVAVNDIIANTPRLVNSIRNIVKTITIVKKEGKLTFVNKAEILPILIAKADTFRDDQRWKSATESVVTTKEIFETLRTPSGHANHAVRLMSKPTAYSEKELLIAPYTLGAWLGDGYKHAGVVCGIDDEVFANITADGYTIGAEVYDGREGKHENLKAVRFENLHVQLKALNLLKNKHIPTEYLYSSVEQREALVAGLLDTDGYVGKNGQVQFTNTNKDIIDGLRQILHSLAYQTTLTSKIPTYTYEGEKKQGQVAYTITFYPKTPVFRISRKADAHEATMRKGQGHRQAYRYIVDVQPVASVPMSCITVDSENHLYLATDAFITTHNTSMLNALSGCIPADERVITIEDNLELRLNPSKHILAMETKQKGAGATDIGVVTIRDLVKNALRMRPDRIIVGEVRDEAAYDMLQAMNTGHDGSMTTVHANDPEGAIDRLTNLISQVGDFSPERALSLLANGVDIIVQVERYEDGSRRVSKIAELPSKLESKGRIITLEPRILWEFQQTGTELREDDEGNEKEYIVGEYVRVNELSEATIRKHRLDKKESLTLEQIYKLSAIPKDEIMKKLFKNESADS